MGRLSPQQGFLVSATVHLTILMLLINRSVATPTLPIPTSSPTPAVPATERVYLPRADIVRLLRFRPHPVPPPTPVPRVVRDRMSVGPPSLERARGPLVLRREDDLTAVPKGTPQGASDRRPLSGLPTEEVIAADKRGAPAAESGLTLPPGLGRPERSGSGGPAAPGASPGPARTLGESLRDLDRRLADAGSRGLSSGTGQQIGPFFFDPEGADFTAWLNHFKNEVYRNWIVPQPALLGMGGQVDLELTVERDGRVSSARLLQSAGNVALDRAARNALLGSRAWALPADFGPPRVVMRVSFLYNVRPQGS